MATSNEPLQLNLGSLRSAMSLTLHTHHASRIWHGRAAAEGRPGIVGLNGYIAVMNRINLQFITRFMSVSQSLSSA